MYKLPVSFCKQLILSTSQFAEVKKPLVFLKQTILSSDKGLHSGQLLETTLAKTAAKTT